MFDDDDTITTSKPDTTPDASIEDRAASFMWGANGGEAGDAMNGFELDESVSGHSVSISRAGSHAGTGVAFKLPDAD